MGVGNDESSQQVSPLMVTEGCEDLLDKCHWPVPWNGPLDPFEGLTVCTACPD